MAFPCYTRLLFHQSHVNIAKTCLKKAQRGQRLKFDPKWSLSYFQPIAAAILVTIAMVKVKLIQTFKLVILF